MYDESKYLRFKRKRAGSGIVCHSEVKRMRPEVCCLETKWLDWVKRGWINPSVEKMPFAALVGPVIREYSLVQECKDCPGAGVTLFYFCNNE